jgi:hypothetical protein
MIAPIDSVLDWAKSWPNHLLLDIRSLELLLDTVDYELCSTANELPYSESWHRHRRTFLMLLFIRTIYT